MKIECSRQTWAGQTDTQTHFVPEKVWLSTIGVAIYENGVAIY